MTISHRSLGPSASPCAGINRTSVGYRLIEKSVRSLADNFKCEIGWRNKFCCDRTVSLSFKPVTQSAINLVQLLPALDGGGVRFNGITEPFPRLNTVHGKLFSLPWD